MNYRFVSPPRLAILLAVSLCIAVPANAAFDNVWNFGGDLTATTGSGTMSFAGGAEGVSMFTTPSAMGIASLYGDTGSAGVLGFSAYAPGQQLDIAYGTTDTITDYTMIWDVLYPTESNSLWRPLYQTGDNLAVNDDGDLFLRVEDSAIGISGQYHGTALPDVWNRFAITINSTDQKMRKYINGVFVGSFDYSTHDPPTRWDLTNGVYSILGDDNNETALGYISSYRVTDTVMTTAEIAALGGVHANGANVAGELPPVAPPIDTVWNFNGNLDALSGNATMTYRGNTDTATSFGTTAALGLPAISGDDGTTQVMSFPATDPTQGYTVDFGTDVPITSYSMVFDILYPAASDATWRALLQTSADNSDDCDFAVHASVSGGIGIGGQYAGSIVADTWHRIVFTIDEEFNMVKYIDGIEVGTQTATSNHNLSSSSIFHILTDNDGETAAGYLASYRFTNSVLTAAEVAELGGVYATGAATGAPDDKIPGDANDDGKVDGSDVTILAGNWQVGVTGGGATWEMGDFNNDGKVDGSDVTILAGNWQYGVTAATAAVPEPSTIVLLIVGLAGLIAIRRRK